MQLIKKNLLRRGNLDLLPRPTPVAYIPTFSKKLIKITSPSSPLEGEQI